MKYGVYFLAVTFVCLLATGCRAENAACVSEEYRKLADNAIMAREKSYCPYSNYAVGAALLTEDGRVFTGCNVENASYPVGVCAERVAFGKAVSEGCRKFKAIAIAGAVADKQGSDFCSPCGMCRQFMREFYAGDFSIILVESNGKGLAKYKLYSMEDILPDSFGPSNLK